MTSPCIVSTLVNPGLIASTLDVIQPDLSAVSSVQVADVLTVVAAVSYTHLTLPTKRIV